jgi:hypothetical protein
MKENILKARAILLILAGSFSCKKEKDKDNNDNNDSNTTNMKYYNG